MYACFTAPNVLIEQAGTFDFYGSIRAAAVWVNGKGRFNLDEDCYTPRPLEDMSFALRKASQRYR